MLCSRCVCTGRVAANVCRVREDEHDTRPIRFVKSRILVEGEQGLPPRGPCGGAQSPSRPYICLLYYIHRDSGILCTLTCSLYMIPTKLDSASLINLFQLLAQITRNPDPENLKIKRNMQKKDHLSLNITGTVKK